MLTRTGKIIFTIIILLAIVLGGRAFLKSNPDIGNLGTTPNQTNSSTDHLVDGITTESLSKLSSPLSTYSIGVDTVASSISFSPDNHHVLFEATATPVSGQQETGNHIILGDLVLGTYKKIYDGMLVGAPSWSLSSVVFASDGVYLYNTTTGDMKVVTNAPGRRPLISPDGSKVVYVNKGLILYSLTTDASTTLSTSDDVPGAWYGDNTHILYFKSDGTQLGEGAGTRKTVASFDLVTKSIKEFTSIPSGTFGTARFIDDAHAHVMGGFDDGRSDYILNISSDTAVTLNQNVLVSESFVDIDATKVYVYNLGTLSVYSKEGTLLSKKDLEGSAIAPNLPYQMNVYGNRVALVYVPVGSTQATIKIWNMTTGQNEETVPQSGTVVFFGPATEYVTLKDKSTTLDFSSLPQS